MYTCTHVHCVCFSECGQLILENNRLVARLRQPATSTHHPRATLTARHVSSRLASSRLVVGKTVSWLRSWSFHWHGWPCLSIWLFNNASTSWQGVVKCCAHTLVRVCKHSTTTTTTSPTQFRQWSRSKVTNHRPPSDPLAQSHC